MGFFEKIISIFRGPDYDKKAHKLSERIAELLTFKRRSEDKLKKLNSYTADTAWYKITPPSSTSKKQEGKTFAPTQIHPTLTMKGLMEKRKREEAERVRQLKESVAQSFLEVQGFISDENANSAETRLFQIAPIVEKIKDESISSRFNSLVSDIENLKQVLIEREVRRKQEEERKRQERELQIREDAERKRKLEEAERLRKEREARGYEERLEAAQRKLQEEIERLTALFTREKPEANEIITYLRAKGVRVFYHFADRKNLNSIRKLGGLYSWDYMESNGIEIPRPGGDGFSRGYDIRNGLEDYVRLSFCPSKELPMAWHKYQAGYELVQLEVEIDVAAFEQTRFADRNAASQSVNLNHGPNMSDLQKVNIPATKRTYVARAEGEVFELHQAECMVKTFIPIKFIRNIDRPTALHF